jgi:thymidylate synthase (FAD)
VNIVTPYARLVAVHPGEMVRVSPTSDVPFALPDEAGVPALRLIEGCGRISHRSEDAQTDDSWRRFILAVVMGHGDWSIVEHATASVMFVVDRGITHEIVRHRLFSYTQESTRFVNYEKKLPPTFVEPPWLSDEVTRAANGEPTEFSTRQVWRHAIHEAEFTYKNLVGRGVAPQIARSVFSNALVVRLVMTGNLRSWRHFSIMRTTKEAHPQLRQVTLPLLAEFKRVIPLLYDDIQPEARQADNLRLPR